MGFPWRSDAVFTYGYSRYEVLAGFVNAVFLVFVGVSVVAAIVTPPDPISMISLAVPLCLLYEASIWCVKLIELRRAKEDAARGIVTT